MSQARPHSRYDLQMVIICIMVKSSKLYAYHVKAPFEDAIRQVYVVCYYQFIFVFNAIICSLTSLFASFAHFSPACRHSTFIGYMNQSLHLKYALLSTNNAVT